RTAASARCAVRSDHSPLLTAHTPGTPRPGFRRGARRLAGDLSNRSAPIAGETPAPRRNPISASATLESWRAAAAVVLLAVYSVARYRDALLSFFFLDDFWLLRTGAEFPWGSLFGFAQVFRPTHVGFQLYRPLTQTGYFALLWPLCGTDATGYHAVQLLAFVAAVLLVFAIARRLTGSVAGATGAGLIYATAPGHAVAVFWLAAFTMIGTAL